MGKGAIADGLASSLGFGFVSTGSSSGGRPTSTRIGSRRIGIRNDPPADNTATRTSD
jgi:hypothetical protein